MLHLQNYNTFFSGQWEMLKGFMIMPEEIVKLLGVFVADKSLSPDELYLRSDERKAASETEMRWQKVLIVQKQWKRKSGLGRRRNKDKWNLSQ